MPLRGVEAELCHGPPLHFVLRLEGLEPLGGAEWPDKSTDWQRLSSIGFRWVICAASDGPGYDPSPLEFLDRIELQDLSGGRQSLNPAAEFKKIAAIASNAYSKLEEGGILVHCVGGRGRTGTIIGAILRYRGYDSAEIIDFLDAAYRRAGKPAGWPESPWQSQVIGRLQVPPAGADIE
jgi:Tyrosine phosphatase family